MLTAPKDLPLTTNSVDALPRVLITPANIFITDEETVKLLDFGIARLIARPQTTQWGVMMGTPAFMAPEQARGHWEQVDCRTDLWAVGATVFRVDGTSGS